MGETCAAALIADRHVLKTVTHGEPKSIMDLYTTYPWPTKCEAVAKLKVQVQDTPLGAQSGHSLGTVAHRAQARWGATQRKRTGIEPAVPSRKGGTIGFEDRARHQSGTRFRGGK